MNQALSTQKVTPMMAQWNACKRAAENAVLLFRMGDFYEAFYDDAELMAKELGITLTKRQGIPMAGVPVHTCESYVDKLVGKGYRVAVAEQVEDPKKTKGLVKREVVRVVTPGTLVDSALLNDKDNNFFAALTLNGPVFGLAFLDLSTGEFRVIEFDNPKELLSELYRLRPSEFLVSRKFQAKHGDLLADLKVAYQFLINEVEDWHFDWQNTANFLVEHFRVQSLDGFGLKEMTAAVSSAGALLRYLQDELCLAIQQIRSIGTYSTAEFMSLDQTTQRNLELTESLQDGSRRNTLLGIMDRTHTPMGGRLLHRWLKQPLLCVEAIVKRQDACQAFVDNRCALDECNQLLGQVRDLERLMMKIASAYASPRDIATLRFSLLPLPMLQKVVGELPAELLRELAEGIEDFEGLTTLIGHALVDEPPARLGEGKLFRKGFNAELDELADLSKNGKDWLAQYQTHLRETLDIKTLKVGYNRVFGYYIEVSKGQSDRMPNQFSRRQTLANSERFLSPELKAYEEKILSAEDRIAALENQLYTELRQQVAAFSEPVLRVATAIANIDCLQSLASLARDKGYTRPLVDESDTLDIAEGRHPVIEDANLSERFVPNDTQIDSDKQRCLIITGPNMAGKSTYIRQVALLSIMAQMGSFIPADSARIGIVDKVFTRIGASDDLSRGQSTFMVEMTETANILNNATSKSLVILDEIGRGTSTYDGISIAWAVAEFLLTAEGRRAKTLFATHYWELTKLEELIPGAVNLHVAVRECEDSIVFLRKILPGNTDKSYGIHVAQLAGLPEKVVSRAKSILEHLEDEGRGEKVFEPPQASSRKVMGTKLAGDGSEIQFLLFEPAKKRSKKKVEAKADPIREALKKVDVDNLSPREAHDKLAQLVELLN